MWLIRTRRVHFWPPVTAPGPSEIRNSVFRMGELAIIKPAYAVHTPGRKERKFPVLLGWARKTNQKKPKAQTEREIFLFDGPGGAMGIGFFCWRWDLFFARQRGKNPGDFLVFWGVFFCVFWWFFFLEEVFLCFWASFFFSRVSAKLDGFFSAGLWAKPGIPALATLIITWVT